MDKLPGNLSAEEFVAAAKAYREGRAQALREVVGLLEADLTGLFHSERYYGLTEHGAGALEHTRQTLAAVRALLAGDEGAP